MKTAAYQKKNKNALPYHTSRVYLDFKGCTFLTARVGSYVWEKSPCTTSKRVIAENLAISQATVFRSLKRLEKQDKISRNKSEITANGDTHKRKYCKYPDFLNEYIFDFTINIKNEPKQFRRPLTPSELNVYSEIFTWLTSPKNTTGFYLTSISMLSKITGYSERTVWAALLVLLKCKLINRTADNKGTSSAHMSSYTINKDTLRRISKIMAKRNTATPPTTDEVQKYYRDLRTAAEDLAEFNKNAVLKDKTYRELDQKRRDMVIKEAFASAKAEKPAATANDILVATESRKTVKELDKLIKLRLEELGFNEYDLTPQYYCKKCNDTGQLKDGSKCNCYIRRFGTTKRN